MNTRLLKLRISGSVCVARVVGVPRAKGDDADQGTFGAHQSTATVALEAVLAVVEVSKDPWGAFTLARMG